MDPLLVFFITCAAALLQVGALLAQAFDHSLARGPWLLPGALTAAAILFALAVSRRDLLLALAEAGLCGWWCASLWKQRRSRRG